MKDEEWAIKEVVKSRTLNREGKTSQWPYPSVTNEKKRRVGT